jgi:hypothetical protein
LPRYRRAAHYPPIQVGRPKQRLLEAIGRFDYLTAPQLAQLLYCPSSLTYVQDHLKQLYHAGYVRRVWIPTITPNGSSPATYTLDRKGHAWLAQQGRVLASRFRPSESAERELLFLRHTLDANALLIAAELATRGEDCELVQLRTEHELKRAVVYVQVGDERIGVANDGWVEFRRGMEQACVAFELDRGTEGRKQIQRKIRGLVHFARGPYQEAFGVKSLTIVFVTTAGARRLQELLSWSEKELSRLDASADADLFRFAAVNPRGIDAHTLFFVPLFTCPFDGEPRPLLFWSIGGGN